MNRPSTVIRHALIWLLLPGLTACSYIKSWFPDKERDYQFRSEIAPLIIPDDLKAKAAPTLPPQRTPQQLAAAAVATADAEIKKTQEPAPAKAAAQPVEASASPESNASAVTASAPASVSSLQIDQSRGQAWRIVGKALTQQKIEIVERNIEQGYFYVRFDMDAVKAEDNTFWDELNFMFGDDPSNEQEYRISLSEVSAQATEVTVQDGEGKNPSNRTANALLKLIAEGINRTASQAADAAKPVATE